MGTSQTSTFDLKPLLKADCAPYEHVFTDGAFAGLHIRYRDARQIEPVGIIGDARDKFADLGLDPDVAAKSLIVGLELPAGQRLSVQAQLAKLSEEDKETLQGIIEHATGALVAGVLAEWNDPNTPINADTCAALPDGLKRAILKLAANPEADEQSGLKL